MKFLNTVLLSASVLATSLHAQEPYTIKDYNSSNLKHGVVFNWEYKPTFYTGFAPRVEEPTRIYTKASRGNITRVTTILDKRSILTYMFNLKKRYEVFNKIVNEGYIKEYHLNQREMFNQIIESKAYKILPTIEAFEKGKVT
ncbi:hypothetical protein N9N67_12385, partial [Bacteriovoracaceae bacterium]|nr:hypothetical protein [Bacteriovoracaceae bacterium]